MMRAVLLAVALASCAWVAQACSQPGCDAGHTMFAPDVIGPKAFRAVLRGFEYGFTGTMDGILVNDELDLAVRHGETYVFLSFLPQIPTPNYLRDLQDNIVSLRGRFPLAAPNSYRLASCRSKRYEAYRLSTGMSIWKTPPKQQRAPSSAGFINLGYGYQPVIIPPGAGRTPAIVGIQSKCTFVRTGTYSDECTAIAYDAVSLDPSTGTERWRTTFSTRWETWISSPVADSEGNIYFVSTDYNYNGRGFNVTAISSTGAVLWNTVFPPGDYSMDTGNSLSDMVPAVAESRGVVLVPHMYGIFGLDLKTGQIVWNGRNPEEIFNCGLAFVAEAADRVLCSANKGRVFVAWSLASANVSFTIPFYLDKYTSTGNVYAAVDPVRGRVVISRWNELEARSLIDGSFLWKRILIRDTRGLTFDSVGSLYAISALLEQSWIYKIDGETGTLINRIGLSRMQMNSLALSKQGLFIGCSYYVLVATEGRSNSLTIAPQAAAAPPLTTFAPVSQTTYSPSVKRLPDPVDPNGVNGNVPAVASDGISAGGVFGITFAASTVLAAVAGFFLFRNLHSSPGAAGYFRFG